MEKKAVLTELQQIPGIGRACSRDLWNLGIRRISDLRKQDPSELYRQLNSLTGVTQDICMLYTFRCAVYFATVKKTEPKKLKWWYWKGKTFNERSTVNAG